MTHRTPRRGRKCFFGVHFESLERRVLQKLPRTTTIGLILVPIVVVRRAKPWFQAWTVLGYFKGHEFVFGIDDTLVINDCKRIKHGGLHYPALQLQTQSPRATQLQLLRTF